MEKTIRIVRRRRRSYKKGSCTDGITQKRRTQRRRTQRRRTQKRRT
jgi:hypothetical protein